MSQTLEGLRLDTFKAKMRYFMTADWPALVAALELATEEQIREARKYHVPPLIMDALTGAPKKLTREPGGDDPWTTYLNG